MLIVQTVPHAKIWSCSVSMCNRQALTLKRHIVSFWYSSLGKVTAWKVKILKRQDMQYVGCD